MHRANRALLFQPTDAAVRTAPGWPDEAVDKWGPNRTYVCLATGWPWANSGGDGVDAAYTPQGAVPWASVPTPTGVAGTVYDHSMVVTDALRYVQESGRWCAFKLVGSAAPRRIAGPLYANAAKRPRIAVTYKDGSTATLACNVAAFDHTGNEGLAVAGLPEVQLPCFIDFDRPAKAVDSATLQFSVTEQHWSGAPTDVKLAWVMTPPLNAAPVQQGLAAAAGALDLNIAADPAVIAAHRYMDGTALSDFLVDAPGANMESESNYDPAIWGGTANTASWPHTVAGKWLKGAQFQANSNPTLVTSAQLVAAGVTPLAPGMGALRIARDALTIANGQEVGENGTLLLDMRMLMPESLFGRLARVFVRYYELQRKPVQTFPADRKPVLSMGLSKWTDMAGKSGWGPAHQCSEGGNSQKSGGGFGWQMRHSWYSVDTGLSGPMDLGEVRGFHLYDFMFNASAGHQYQTQPTQWERWGKAGGLGGVVYANQWVCIETEMQLNAIAPHATDGALRCWRDGRLVYERTGMEFRKLPLNAQTYQPSRLRPARELGVTSIWGNDFFGGRTQQTIDREVYRTALVVATQYIGPMAGVTPALQVSGTTYTPNRDASGNVLQSDLNQLPVLGGWLEVNDSQAILDSAIETPHYMNSGGGDGAKNIVEVWCGMAWDVATRRGWMWAGGGHGGTRNNDNACYELDATRLRFSRIKDRTSEANIRAWNASIGAIETSNLTSVENVVQGDGVIGTTHTYDGIKWVPPGFPGAGPVKGGLHVASWARQTLNLDTGAVTTAWWNKPTTSPFTDWSYCATVRVGNVLYHPRSAFSVAKFDAAATQATDHSATSAGALSYSFASHATNFVHNHRAFCDMAARREAVSISGAAGAPAVRMRYGAAHDSGSTNWSSYLQTIALTSADGSHNDFAAANFTDPGGGNPSKFFGCTPVYDDKNQCLWMQGNEVGDNLYRISNLHLATWTTQRITGVTALRRCINGTYGRFAALQFGDVVLGVRVSSTTDKVQIVRLS